MAAASLLSERHKNAQNKRIRFVGIDTDPTVLQAIRDGYIDGTIAQNPFGHGYVSCALLKLMLDGWKPAKPYQFIEAGDVVSDRGTEIYNLIAARHIDTVLIMGVHANMCILNRSFGIKQMARWGVPCILVRDLTDAMYNPKSWPYVSHAAGTD